MTTFYTYFKAMSERNSRVKVCMKNNMVIEGNLISVDPKLNINLGKLQSPPLYNIYQSTISIPTTYSYILTHLHLHILIYTHIYPHNYTCIDNIEVDDSESNPYLLSVKRLLIRGNTIRHISMGDTETSGVDIDAMQEILKKDMGTTDA